MIKILIIGEYSGFTKNLVHGFLSLKDSPEVVVFSNQDGFKSIQQDVVNYTYAQPHNINILGVEIKKSHHIQSFFEFRKFKKDISLYQDYFDIVFILNPEFIRNREYDFVPLFSFEDINCVRKASSRVYLSACGIDAVFLDQLKADRDFSYPLLEIAYESPKYRALNQEVLNYVDGIIPVTGYYAEAYKNSIYHDKLLDVIPLPFDCKSVFYQDRVKHPQISIFDGVLREYKGTMYVNKALEIIMKQYGERVKVIRERRPYSDFIKSLSSFDIYMDQCSKHFGMSALISMSAGCLTFTGCSSYVEESLNCNSIPVVAIHDNYSDIVDKLCWWIEHPEHMMLAGKKSREYVERIHSSEIVAYNYMKVFSQNRN